MDEIELSAQKIEKNETPEIEKYEKHYSETGLMEKLKGFSKVAGLKVVYAVLLLYYVLQSNSVPYKEKAKIVGALGYFILPLDLVPDMILGLGFTDDLAALLYVIHAMRKWITESVKEQARTKLLNWFDTIDEQELSEIV